jgi:glucosamine kinase
MKKLLIESGATKAEWCFITENGYETFTGKGWNASSSKDDLEIDEQRKSWIEASDKIYFYGAGVSSEYSTLRTKQQFGLHKNCHAQSDLVAACIATLGKSEGIVGILGTGSISCVWDGEKAKVVVPSLGYLLSDEGSGSDIGKEVLRAYFYKTMPEGLRIKFLEDYDLDVPKVIDQIYNHPTPKSFMANFSRFLSNHPHPWCNQIVQDRLKSYFQIRINPIFNKKVKNLGFVGSIAFVFKDFLIDICSDLEIENLTIYPSAMEGIIKYHQLYE